MASKHTGDEFIAEAAPAQMPSMVIFKVKRVTNQSILADVSVLMEKEIAEYLVTLIKKDQEGDV